MATSGASTQRDVTVPPAYLSNGASAVSTEFSETTTVSLEWRLTGLKQMYETSKGSTKSKCIKSVVFGDADTQWEVLWYPNSGVQGGEFASLYLSCVPTLQEKEQGISGKWTRKGLWLFRFDIKVVDERTGKLTLFSTKEASDHTFAAKTANWGWQQFVKRDHLFLDPRVTASDTFTIVCTISGQPSQPLGQRLGLVPPPRTPGSVASSELIVDTTASGGPKCFVPKELVSAVGEMFDDPYIEFVIPSRPSPSGLERAPPRRIYANKKLLNRCEYFDNCFHGGFGEAEGMESTDDDDEEFDIDTLSDSDVEDEAANMVNSLFSSTTTRDETQADTTHKIQPDPFFGEGAPVMNPAEMGHEHDMGSASSVLSDEDMEIRSQSMAEGDDDLAEESHEAAPSVPVRRVSRKRLRDRDESSAVVGPKKTRVTIKDAAWSTWWAVLYWLYTDTIYFAPLSSSFGDGTRRTVMYSGTEVAPDQEPRSRREWMAQWLLERGMREGEGPAGPRPVSAKSVYRLADKLVLPALKLRAFQHICNQLTPLNIPAEVFSRFSSTFDDVRKVQVAFFLQHWGEIKKSDTMQNIWRQIRGGKHVGFEEVWPLILSQLDFCPS